jgi:hypothetical protein
MATEQTEPKALQAQADETKQPSEVGSGERAFEPSAEGGGTGEGAPELSTEGAEAGIRPAQARGSFETIRVEVEKVEERDVIVVKVDPRRMAAVAHSVAQRDAAPARRAMFERLAASGFYVMTTLGSLPDLARGAWYARQQQLYVTRESSQASVPEEVVKRGYEVRERMLVTVGYWMYDDAKVMTRLETIREGSGYLDLASDLEGLAELYDREEIRTTIAHDFKRYRPTDRAEALAVASELFASLGMGEASEMARWAGLSQRATTLLVRAYEEHRRCGQFAFFDDEDVAVTYPSLIAAVRSAPSKRAPAEPPAGDEEVAVAGV